MFLVFATMFTLGAVALNTTFPEHGLDVIDLNKEFHTQTLIPWSKGNTDGTNFKTPPNTSLGSTYVWFLDAIDSDVANAVTSAGIGLGSHHSFSFQRVTPLEAMFPKIWVVAAPMVQRMAKTQTKNIAEQLNMGVTYLDMRISEKYSGSTSSGGVPEAYDMVVDHGQVFCSMVDGFKQVIEAIEETKNTRPAPNKKIYLVVRESQWNKNDKVGPSLTNIANSALELALKGEIQTDDKSPEFSPKSSGTAPAALQIVTSIGHEDVSYHRTNNGVQVLDMATANMTTYEGTQFSAVHVTNEPGDISKYVAIQVGLGSVLATLVLGSIFTVYGVPGSKRDSSRRDSKYMRSKPT